MSRICILNFTGLHLPDQTAPTDPMFAYQSNIQQAFLQSAMAQNIRMQQQLLAQNQAFQQLLMQQHINVLTRISFILIVF